MIPGAYGWLLLAGVAVSAALWMRTARRDSRLPLIYVGGLLGALVGAKVVYLLAEGWLDLSLPNPWLRLATGKTILGGLLFGYAGVELAKRSVGYSQPTGDWFALITPLGILFGRVGCWLQGCCPGNPCAKAWYTVDDSHGVARWPAVPIELGFNLAALALLLVLHRLGHLKGQLFHLYLVGYGTFRFVHEFFRDTPRILGPFSGYHLAALAVAGLGAVRFAQRRREGLNRPASRPA